MSTWKPQLPPFRAFKKKVYLQKAETAQFIYQLGEKDTIRIVSKPVAARHIASSDTKKK